MTSTIKVDNIQKVSDGSNLIKKCGSTITLGSSGASVVLGCGATQTGFGRTGTVDWCTTAKTGPFTAVNGDGFFVNTTSGGITVTLPSSPSAGDIVAFKDYAGTWACNAVSICRNGSKINGGCFNATLNTKAQSVTLIYVDGTKGWQDIHDSTSNVSGVPTFIVASGGTITTSGDFKIHTFNSSSTFTVCTAPTPANNNVSYLVVAGGGGASNNIGGGAGAGGFREGKTPATPYTASPLVAPAGLPISVGSFPVTVGGGGVGGDFACAANGSSSIFSSITSAGGGKSGDSTGGGPVATGQAGGSGGGGASGTSGNPGGAGNTPPVSPPQGNNGGNGSGPGAFPQLGSGGGGGATAACVTGTTSASGNGGAGASSEISGSAVVRAGGGGGRTYTCSSNGTGGTGGGAPGGAPGPSRNGTANTGGGAGGGAGTGGSGVVVIRYKFQ